MQSVIEKTDAVIIIPVPCISNININMVEKKKRGWNQNKVGFAAPDQIISSGCLTLSSDMAWACQVTKKSGMLLYNIAKHV